ncbi:flagellar motor protein [Oleiagrimonas sp. C23AA]|uniref:flagellar motor protein n=1 Tax=Oleiagrimonas sp. C23AA TaxID=2719047 RepID=UPI001422A721|nr:flagellar motor protein [Oleiagrimonas sp. C23AA]NII09173.1 flagellar motor protein [Oleiagrimonas sp. C23AA]
MDLLSIIGTILAFVVIIAGTLLKGGTLAALWNPAAFVIVFVGTTAAVMVQTPAVTLKRALSMLPWVFQPPRQTPLVLIDRIVRWSEISRRQGLLGLEAEIDDETDAFVRKGLQLLVDGTEPETLRSVLEVEIATREHADMDAAKLFENAGIYSPTMGIIGAVMGLMAVMQNLTDPGKLGHGIAAAFVATIYGIGLANLLMLPMSAKLKAITRLRVQQREILVEGLMSIAHGENPKHIDSKLQGFLL